MEPRTWHPGFDGAVGGVLAGVVVMLWFAVVDLVAGQPLATPSTLAGAFLHQEGVEASFAMIAGYTVIHLFTFLVLGVAAALVLNLGALTPRLLYGALYGVVVLNAVHYGALLAVRADFLTMLPAVHVLGANVVGGVALMGYLHRVQGAQSAFGLGALRNHPVLACGVEVGLLGGLAVAVWFLAVDALTGRPMFTPAALGSAVFLGAASAAEVSVSVGTVAAYTALHFAAFVVVGMLLVAVARLVTATPAIWLLVLMGFIVVEAGFLGAAVALGSWVLDALGMWAIAVGNLAALGVMGWHIWRTHPRLRRQLAERPAETMV